MILDNIMENGYYNISSTYLFFFGDFEKTLHRSHHVSYIWTSSGSLLFSMCPKCKDKCLLNFFSIFLCKMSALWMAKNIREELSILGL